MLPNEGNCAIQIIKRFLEAGVFSAFASVSEVNCKATAVENEHYLC